MNETQSAPTVQSNDDGGASDLASYVDGKINPLQSSYVAGSSAANATLARLRRAVGKPPGSVPEVWEITLAGVPLQRGRQSDEPTRYEYAAHTALTLYAIHQQSQGVRMHVRGVGLGTAVRRLAMQTSAEDAVTRRFHAIGTATGITEVAFHARGLITQLRGAGIALDYGQFAQQLYWLQDSRWASRVRLDWGRDFHARLKAEAGDIAESTETNGDSQ